MKNKRKVLKNMLKKIKRKDLLKDVDNMTDIQVIYCLKNISYKFRGGKNNV